MWHAGEVAGAGQRHQDSPFTEVAPQRQAVDVTGDVVDVGVRPVQGFFDRALPGIGRGRPQGESYAHREDRHRLMVGAVCHDGQAVA